MSETVSILNLLNYLFIGLYYSISINLVLKKVKRDYGLRNRKPLLIIIVSFLGILLLISLCTEYFLRGYLLNYLPSFILALGLVTWTFIKFIKEIHDL